MVTLVAFAAVVYSLYVRDAPTPASKGPAAAPSELADELPEPERP